MSKPLSKAVKSRHQRRAEPSSEALTLKECRPPVETAHDRSRLFQEQGDPNDSATLEAVVPLEARIRESRTGLVFESREGKAIQSVRTAFTNACERAKLSGVTPHTLRHTFASRLGMAG